MTEHVDTRVPIRTTQRKLIVLWMIGAALPFSLVTIQSLVGLYGDQAGEALRWVSSAVLPVTIMVIGTIVADEQTYKNKVDRRSTSQFFARLTMYTSAFYLAVVMLALVIGWLAHPTSPLERIRTLRTAELFSGTLQGIVGGTLGVFFVRRSEEGAK